MPLEGIYEPSPMPWAADQVALYESSGGTEGNTIMDLPVVIVTSVGAKSHKIRKTPLMRVEYEGNYLAVASMGGAPEHPVWYYNLKNEPHCEIQDGPHKSDRRARLLEGEERSLWWQRAVDAFPNYAEYQKNTTREIPLFLLEPWS